MKVNKIMVAGNLTRDVEMKYMPNGKAVANFSIAVNDSYKKDGEGNVSYLDIVVFEKQAENCNEYLSKGSPVFIEGKLKQRRWEAQDGSKRSKVEIVAHNVQFLDSKPKDASTCNDSDIPF